MKLLTKGLRKSDENAKTCQICQDKYENIYLKDKIYCKVRDHCHYTGEFTGDAHNICNSKYSVPKNVSFEVMNNYLSFCSFS